VRRAFVIYLLVCAVLAGSLFATASGAGNILAAINNTINGNQGTIISEQAVKCWVSDTPAGTAVTTVKESSSGGEYMYWLTYLPGKTIHSLSFFVLFQGKGWGQSPLVFHWQEFSWPSGYGGGTTTPFGVPWWGGDPIIGPAYIIPIVDGTVMWAELYAFSVTK